MRSLMPRPAPEHVARAARFKDRQARWRAIGRPIAHAEVEAAAPAILACMFDHALAIVGPAREYAYRADTGQTVRLNIENWRWTAMDGTAEGRGLYELWAWRFDMPVSRAAYQIRACMRAAAERKAA